MKLFQMTQAVRMGKKKKKKKDRNKQRKACIMVLKKLPHNKKLFTLNERATL